MINEEFEMVNGLAFFIAHCTLHIPHFFKRHA